MTNNPYTSGMRLAFFLATSGHSGVDRVMKNLMKELAHRDIKVDLLRIKNHGPYMESSSKNVNIIELGTSHVNSSLLKLIRYMKKYQPYAILSDKDRVNRVVLLAVRIAGVPTKVFVRTGTTVSVHLKQRSLSEKWFQYLSFNYLYQWADAVIVPSHGAAEDLFKISGLSRDQIRVLHSPVVSQELYNSANENIDHSWFSDDQTPIILGVGELSDRKDFSTLIKAFALVRRERPCKLVILGEGRKRDDLIQLSADLKVEEDVWLPGFIQNPYPYMKQADLFVLTSNCEGSPVVLIEALSLGVPSVSTDCPSGPREILQDGRVGSLVPVGDVDALSKAMIHTIENPLPKEILMSAIKPYEVSYATEKYLSVLM